MLTRLWITEFDVDRRDELERFAFEVSAPMFRGLRGCLGYIYAVEGSTWITQTFWATENDIVRAESSALYRDVVSRILEAGFLAGDQTTTVLQVAEYAPPVAGQQSVDPGDIP